MRLHRKMNPHNLATSPVSPISQLYTTTSFSPTLCGETESSEFFPLLPKHHVKSGKTPIPSLPTRRTARHSTQGVKTCTGSEKRLPGVRQNHASSVVVKALCLQNQRVRKGFPTVCKDRCHAGEGDVKARQKSLGEWIWRLPSNKETAAAAHVWSYLEEIPNDLWGPQRRRRDKNICRAGWGGSDWFVWRRLKAKTTG